MSDTNEKEIIHRAASRLSSTVMSFIAEGMAGKSAIFRTEFGDFLSPKAVEQAVAEAERRQRKEIREAFLHELAKTTTPLIPEGEKGMYSLGFGDGMRACLNLPCLKDE